MLPLRNVRGTHDLYGESLEKFIKVEEVVKISAQKYNFAEFRTPIFEFADVFKQNVGESTDIIHKEMYVFSDRNGEQLALRPEGTAPIVRAMVSNGLIHKFPLKYFYIGPMFRYERPQMGRQRQFHQFGFEYLGTNHYSSDVEMISLAVDILKSLGITSYKILLNSLGSNETLNTYKQALIEYLNQHKDKLSEDSIIRLKDNPLRILDSKNPQDRELLTDAPKLGGYLSKEDMTVFNNIQMTLKDLGIEFTIDNSLVRGLDYYTHTVFEIITDDLGAQGTLIAGGRYNNMIKNMGGSNVGAFGFAGGIERISLMLATEESISKSIAVISANEEVNSEALLLAKRIRDEYLFASSFILGKDIGAKLKKVNAKEFCAVIIVSKVEETLQIEVKDAVSFDKNIVATDSLGNFLTSTYATYQLIK